MNTEAQNENGEHMRLMFMGLNLAAASSFSDARPTWTGATRLRTRVGYILILMSQLVDAISCAVDRDIELTEAERGDHNALDIILSVARAEGIVSVADDAEVVPNEDARILVTRMSCAACVEF